MRNNRQRRGTVIMLAVAVLALLAVMGTAYLLMSRVDRSSTRATTDTVNFDFARDSVMDDVRRTMLNTIARPSDGAMLVTQTPQIQPWVAGQNYVVGSVVIGKDGQLYGCRTAHTSSLTVDADGPAPAAAAANTRWTAVTGWRAIGYTAPAYVCGPDLRIYVATTNAASGQIPPAAPWTLVGDSITRNFDYPEMPPAAVYGAFGRSAGVATGLGTGGVQDQPWLVRNLFRTNVSDTDFSVLTSQRFNTTSGVYSVNYQFAAPATTPPPNVGEANVVAANEAFPGGVWNLLPFSTASGVRFRYALRILDTSRFANVNTGSVDATITANDTTGQFLTSVFLGQSTIFQGGAADNIANVHSANLNGVRGRGPSVTFDLQGWQHRVLGYERFGLNGAASVTAPDAEWFDLTDEIELRSYGLAGTGYVPRVAAPNTPQLLGTTLAANSVGRGFYTTYSFDRNVNNIGVAYTPAFALTIGGSPVSAPAGGRDVPLTATTTTADQVARNAIYLANVLARVGYNTDEALSLALNYIGQTSTSYRTSCITPNGLTISNGPGAASATYVLNPAPTKKYLAYSAQPFINEIAVSALTNNPPPAGAQYDDFAVELVNPYPAAIDVNGWQMKVNGNAWINDLGATIGGGGVIPANSYVVLRVGTALAVAGTPIAVTDPLPVDPGAVAVTVTLERPYFDAAQQYMVVDRINGADSNWLLTRAANAVYSAQKPNHRPGPVADAWAVTSPTSYGAATTAPTLGVINDVSVVGDAERIGLALTDRFAVLAPPAAQGEIVRANIGDLQGYMRMTTMDNAGVVTTMSDQLAQVSAPVFRTTTTGSGFPQEARIRLDHLYDARAAVLFNFVAHVDRASDGLDQLGVGSVDTINEVRIAGRINVNTASPEVLRAIPFLTDMHVAHIVAYRDRAVVGSFGTYTPAVMPNFLNAAPTYASSGHFPGRGIRSFAELLIPIAMSEGRLQMSPVTPLPNRLQVVAGQTMDNLYGPTSTWAKLFAVATVRSDTFVVYGYMEAVRQHPRDSTTFSNWYLGSITDDPTVSGVSMQRMGRRRFVAIVDRSWCNVARGQPGFVLPRVVAIKDLPQ